MKFLVPLILLLLVGCGQDTYSVAIHSRDPNTFSCIKSFKGNPFSFKHEIIALCETTKECNNVCAEQRKAAK